MTYAKYAYLVAFALLATYLYLHFQDPKAPTLDSLRVQAQESREREIQAQKDREAREDKLSEALYDKCLAEHRTLSGMLFAEKQKESYECWKEELTKTNSGTVTPASSGVPQRIISNKSSNVTNQSTIGPDKKGSSGTRSEVQQTPKTPGKGVGASLPSGGKVPVSQTVNPNGNDKSKGKIPDYWKSYEVAIAQIHKWEGLRLSAYWDHAGYSIGYGSRAKSPTEKISKAEADRRLVSIVKPLLSQVISDFPNLRPEAQGALVSFAYNCPAGYQSVRKNGLQYHGQWCKTASGKKLGGLVKRRAEESKLIFSR